MCKKLYKEKRNYIYLLNHPVTKGHYYICRFLSFFICYTDVSFNPLHSLIFFFLPSNNSLIQEGSTTSDYFVPIIIIITKI